MGTFALKLDAATNAIFDPPDALGFLQANPSIFPAWSPQTGTGASFSPGQSAGNGSQFAICNPSGASQSVNLPAASAVAAYYAFAAYNATTYASGKTVSLTPNGSDTINGVNAAIPVPPLTTVVVIKTDAASWATMVIPALGVIQPYTAKTATYAITNADGTIDCTSGTFTVTLPTAVGITGKIFNIKNSGAGTITMATTSSQTVDGTTPPSLTTGINLTVQSTGANWIIL